MYRKCGEKAKFVVSGGKGSDEVCSEADAMSRYLIEQGIPKDHILLEDRSVNTLQNLKGEPKLHGLFTIDSQCIFSVSGNCIFIC